MQCTADICLMHSRLLRFAYAHVRLFQSAHLFVIRERLQRNARASANRKLRHHIDNELHREVEIVFTHATGSVQDKRHVSRKPARCRETCLFL